MGAITEAAVGVLTQQSAAMPMAQCIPTNSLLSGSLDPLFDKLTGAAGGLFVPLFIMVLVFAVVALIVLALTRKASEVMKGIGMLVAIFIGAPLLILIAMTVFKIVNGACPAF